MGIKKIVVLLRLHETKPVGMRKTRPSSVSDSGCAEEAMVSAADSLHEFPVFHHGCEGLG